MTIAYSSDLHLDFYITEHSTSTRLTQQVANYIKSILIPQPADCLILAGDIGHYNTQNQELLKQLKNQYKHVLLVTGNHDMYLVSYAQQKKYQYNSFNRLDEFHAICKSLDVTVLNGTSIEIDGTTIGGCPMWYNLPSESDITAWQHYMNDSRLIMNGYPIPTSPYSRSTNPTFDTQAYYEQQLAHLKSLSDLDIFVSHVSPIILPDSMRTPKYQPSCTDIFYESDNLELLKNTGATHTIFGHTHIQCDHTHENIRFLASAIGYPQENLPTHIQTFTI